MDNGSLIFALVGLPFWAGVVLAGAFLLLLLPIGINVVIRIVIDGILSSQRDPGRRERAFVRKHQRDHTH